MCKNVISNFAMIVVSCDNYSDLVNTFFNLQKKYMSWFNNNIYLINETTEFYDINAIQIHVGKDVNWTKKVEIALNQIKEDYLLFMLEDYFIGNDVNENYISSAVDIMKKNNLKYYRITAIPNSNKKSKYADYLSAIPNNLRYGINLQCAIFRKDFLYEIIKGKDRNAWQAETDLLKKIGKKYEFNIDGCVLDNRNIIDIHNGVIKGKFVPSTIKFFKKKGILISNKNRKTLSCLEVFSIKLKKFIGKLIPQSLIPKLKKTLKKFGFKFVSDN